MTMERQRSSDSDRIRTTDPGAPGDDNLDQERAEIDGLLRASDHMFDSIDFIQSHQYLEQNLQSGGQ
jgi:hypothetical protein